jgi:hypothetical protein
LLEVQGTQRYSFGPGTLAAIFDALAVLRERERIELESASLLDERNYMQPFVRRALAIVREDDALLEQARREFLEFGLEWHAAQTERIVAGF